MKKYKKVLDVILLIGLVAMSLLAVAPKTFVMPTSLEMLLLALVLGLLAAFLVFLWREQPVDEREAFNQANASRYAYITGSLVLIVTLIIQSFQHHVDPAIPIALLSMIITKLVVQRVKDNS